MRRRILGTVSMVLLAAWLWAGHGVPAQAGEFYSWIDPSGTMVMTDDPSRIPPAYTRSPVSVHRFEEASEPSADDNSIRSRPASDRDVAVTAPAPQNQDGSKPPRADARNANEMATEMAPVTLDAPDGPSRTQYVYVPLLSPLSLGGRTVSGFWSHRSVSSPVEAFKRFLGQHRGPHHRVLIGGGQLQLGNVFNGSSSGMAVGVGGNVPLGPTLYNQVLQEHQLLLQRNSQPFQPPASHGR